MTIYQTFAMTTPDSSFINLKDTLYQKVDSSDDITQIRHLIERCDKRPLLAWTDDTGYDILHHAILSNNIEALGIIFALGLFKPPHEPKSHSYIHLACNLGNKAIVSMLLQERARDNKIANFKWVLPPKVGRVKVGDITKVTPLSIKHIGILMVLITSFFVVKLYFFFANFRDGAADIVS